MLSLLSTVAFAESPDSTTYKLWIEEMKASPKGPFKGILWFCDDGSTATPAKGCGRHGGIQHGQWNENTITIREAGYPIAEIYAELKTDDFGTFDENPRSVTPFILERYLINADDGWIFRKARFYRGALQFEDEIQGASLLTSYLISRSDWRKNHYLILREALRLLPRADKFDLFDEIRLTARRLANQDPAFIPLRNKLHAIPEISDIQAIRDFADTKRGAMREQYESLAAKLESALNPTSIFSTLLKLENLNPSLALLDAIKEAKGVNSSPLAEFDAYANVLFELRKEFEGQNNVQLATILLDASLAIENALMAKQGSIKELFPGLTRKAHLELITANVQALYGVGLLSRRAYRATRAILENVIGLHEIPATSYQAAVKDLALIPSWAARELKWEFSKNIEKFKFLEPKVDLFIPDRLRASPLALISDQTELLQKDSNVLIGMSYKFFSEQTYSGILPLNPGVARGVLVRPGTINDSSVPVSSQIYLVPETTADLPPVAGIITEEQGNSLSHVQLLARNLGIPNVIVGPTLLPRLQPYVGRKIVMVSSPGGHVELDVDGPRWKSLFETSAKKQESSIDPDLDKLDFSIKTFVSLKELRRKDSGRIVGPKAANLGELKATYPNAVTEGVAIPFGIFAEVLKQRVPEGMTLQEWMGKEFTRLKSIKSNTQAYNQQLQTSLAKVREAILGTQFTPAFRQALLTQLNSELGPDGTYGVFVRSDTNVEDLPSFTGAGLNLTVPNVIGIDKILDAIRQVWASPFTERAFNWRQAQMTDPTQVYSSVLLLKTVPVEKSGVMVTANLETGDTSSFTVAVNEGISGVVSDQSAEVLRINAHNGNVHLLSEAALGEKRIADTNGGLSYVPTSQYDKILTETELLKLYEFYLEVGTNFEFESEDGDPVPADIEFGFLKGKLMLFQIRPFLSSPKANIARYFQQLDKTDQSQKPGTVNLDRPITFLRIQ